MAVRGVKKNRAGLEQVDASLRQKRASVLLLFSTSRLFRKQYRTLEFVDRIHKGLGVRCVFVKSGVDTNDKERWETILAVQAMVDQFVVSMNIANVQSAHEGLLHKQLVFGTLTFGYTGEPIEGQFTKLARPRRRIVIDVHTSEIVRLIFRWYVEEGLSINQIVQRLNSDPDIPISAAAIGGQWTRRTVARLLRNSRYRGLWKYGVMEATYQPEADYSRQKMRAEPLKEIQLEELRIISDEIWFAAQIRLSQRSKDAGRRAKDGDEQSRPKILNDLFVCSNPEHGRLHVAGTYGRSMECPVCSRLPWEERDLVSYLNRELAQKMVCAKLAELIRGDEKIVQAALAACELEVDAAQRPDPAELVKLTGQLDQVNRSIEFTRRTAGPTKEDQADAERSVREQQTERAAVVAKIGRLKALIARVPKLPNAEEAEFLVQHLSTVLEEAALNGQSVDAVELGQIIKMLTGGRIELHQMGERKRQRGWLQGRFEVRLLPYLVETLTGAAATAVDGSILVTIDFKRELAIDSNSEKAWDFSMNKEKFNHEIAAELGCSKTYVTHLLKHAAAKRGVPFVDGRSRRSKREQKQSKPMLHQTIADEVMQRLVKETVKDIEAALDVSYDSVKAAIRYWHEKRGLSVPSVRELRNRLSEEARVDGSSPHSTDSTAE